MKKFILAAVLLTLGQMSFAAKVVVFDHEQAILSTKLAKQKIEDLKADPEYAQVATQLESLNADLEALVKEANAKGMTWSDSERAEHNKKIEFIQADRKLAGQKLQTLNASLVNSLAAEMAPKLEKVLKKLIESKDAEIILKKQAAYVAGPSADITKKVTKELDKMK